MPHEPTRACEADHCYLHNEDEPAGASAIVCGECGHAYPDVVALVTADAQLRLDLQLTPLLAEAVADVLEHPDKIFQLIPTCAHCAHDF